MREILIEGICIRIQQLLGNLGEITSINRSETRDGCEWLLKNKHEIEGGMMFISRRRKDVIVGEKLVL